MAALTEKKSAIYTSEQMHTQSITFMTQKFLLDRKVGYESADINKAMLY